MELVLATGNPHKVRELKAMLGKSDLEVLSLRAFPDYVPPPETGATFEENARLKALHAAEALGKTVLADDSGLVVPAINGEPGVFSARYAGDDATDADNRKKLLARMKGLEGLQRHAYFECVLVLTDGEQIRVERGTVEGHILDQERGAGGFGYDPLFVRHDYNQTFAEMDEATKNRISHRNKALTRLLPAIQASL